MPAISVVIPAFNAEATIAETVQSVLQQSCRDFELLIIEPSSTDNTAQVLARFTDPRIRIVHRPQGNVGINRNYGLRLARGEFTAFLDADDLWTPNKLELQVKRLRQTPNADVCYSLSDCIDEAGIRLYPASHATWEGDVYKHLLLSNFVASGSNFIARTAALRRVQGFDETLSNCEDLDICLRLAEEHQFVVVPQVQVFYRMVQNSKSSSLPGVETSNRRILERSYAHPKGLELNHLKSESYGNLYTFLSLKALRGWDPKFVTALRYLALAVRFHPQCLLSGDCYKIVVGASLAMVLSSRWNHALVRRLRDQRAQRYRKSLVKQSKTAGRGYSSGTV